MKNIGFIPYNNTTNMFVSNTIQAIRMAGYNVINGLTAPLNEMDCLLLNWFESLPKGIIHRLYFFIKRIWFLHRCKQKGIKIISYFHNRRPHDTKYSLIDKSLIRYISSVSDRIIILCEGSRKYSSDLCAPNLDEKFVHIPHPNYIGSYPDSDDKTDKTENTNKLKILFFGRVMPYKNIELIIRAANDLQNEPVEFMITGNASEEYKNVLTEKGKGISNLYLDLRFVDDKDVGQVIRNSDIFLLPYDNSILNSGTALLAFSYKKTVIIPSIPILEEYNPSLIYNYDGDEEEYYTHMMGAINKAIEDYKMDKESIKQKGEELFKAVERDNSIQAISLRYKDMLESL